MTNKNQRSTSLFATLLLLGVVLGTDLHSFGDSTATVGLIISTTSTGFFFLRGGGVTLYFPYTNRKNSSS